MPDRLTCTTPDPCPQPFNLAAYVLGQAEGLGDKPALEIVGTQEADVCSHVELRTRVVTTAAGLLAAGMEPGDRLLMRLGNSVEFPVVFLAAIWAGIIPVPTSAQLTEQEISLLAADLKPQAMVFAPGIALPDIRPAISISIDDIPAASTTELPPAMGAADRAAYIIYTSGTSGRARGVVHAHRAVWARRMMWRDWYDLRESDRLMHAGAFNWTYTLGTGLLDPWAAGATALIPGPGIAPADLPALLRRHEATIFAAAPGIFRQMLRQKFPPLPTLRHGLSAGEKLPESVARAWRDATGTMIHEAYGMSECSTFISSSPGRPAPPGTLGFAQGGRKVAILQGNRPAPTGEIGTIAVHRSDPGLMLGYLNAPAETEARFSGDWFATGDTGSMDATGAITFHGRADDMMNAGGFRLSPIEVENAMRDFPGLIDCAAVEARLRPDTSVIALCYTANRSLDEAALAAHAGRRLARYKQPRIYRLVERLPRSANGKIQRHLLRSMDWSRH